MAVKDIFRRFAVRDVELESGLVVGIEPQDFTDLILCGEFPDAVTGLMRELNKKQGLSGEDLAGMLDSDEELGRWREFECRVVAKAVKRVAGEDVTLSWEDVQQMAPDDRRKAFLYAVQAAALPKAERPS